MNVIIEHGFYGCDTGCCGTVFELWDNDKMVDSQFQFDHYDTEEEVIAEAKALYPEALTFEVDNFKCWDF